MAKDTEGKGKLIVADEAGAYLNEPMRRLVRHALRPVSRPVTQVALPELAPLTARDRMLAPERDTGLPAVQPLPPGPKLIFEQGPGGAGKTTLANILVGRYDELGILPSCLTAATDPGVVGLARLLPAEALHQPKSRSEKHAEELLADVLYEVEQDPPPVTLVDAGAGSNALEKVVQRDPGVLARIRAKGVAVVDLWCWTPRVLNLALFRSFRALGVKPDRTAMVLNGSLASSGWEAYALLRGQAEYQAALQEGAAEVFMPALRQEVALEAEGRGLLYHYVAQGKVPAWAKGVAPIEGDDAMEAGLWLPEVDDALASVASWVTP